MNVALVHFTFQLHDFIHYYMNRRTRKTLILITFKMSISLFSLIHHLFFPLIFTCIRAHPMETPTSRQRKGFYLIGCFTFIFLLGLSTFSRQASLASTYKRLFYPSTSLNDANIFEMVCFKQSRIY
jgi:hypothetical protein